MAMWLDPKQEIERELFSNETLLWTGTPPRGLVLRQSDAILIPFSILWCGFAIFWEVGVLTTPSSPLIMKLMGIPFVLVGLFIVGGRFWWDAKRRATTSYGVTNERAIIVWVFPRRSVKSLRITSLAEVNITERPDGSGTLTFGPTDTIWGWAPRKGENASPEFERIPNVRSVLEIIRAQQVK